MRKEVIQTGKTVEAAIETACEQLGCAREDCQWEIIDLPKKSLFGLKSTAAKVRVSVEVPDSAAEAKVVPQQGRKEETPAYSPQARQEPKMTEAKQPAREAERKEAPKESPAREIPPELAGKVRIVKDYLQSVLCEFGLSAELDEVLENGGITVNLTGQGLGAIIGRRGETLDALQYLSSLVANRCEGDYLRVTLDCGDYRKKRRETLESLAAKLSAQVLKTNVSKILEPMNPFERRIIHATVSEIEGVTSTSVGEEPNRRVVITSPTARSSRPPRQGGGGGRPGFRDRRDGDSRNRAAGRDRDHHDRKGGHDRYGGGGRPPRGPSAQTQQSGPPKQTPESATTDTTLYSKINLD